MGRMDLKNTLLLLALLVGIAAFTSAVIAGFQPHEVQGPSTEFQDQTDQVLKRLKEERARQPGPRPPPTPEESTTPGS